MLENITRHLEMGKTRMQATLDGSKEIAFTIVSMTISLAAVFIPVLFMGGVLGRLLHEFAVTIMAAILVSGFVSLSLTPLLCSRMLQPEHTVKHGRLYLALESAFEALRRGYEVTLRATLAFPKVCIAVFFGITLVTAWLFDSMPKGFLPSEDTGQLFAFTEASQDISFDAMYELQQQAAAIIRTDPAVESTMAFMGVSGSSQSINLGRILIPLKARGERPTADEVMARLRPKVQSIPGIKVYLQNFPSIRLGGRLTKSQYQFTLYGADAGDLYRWAPIIEEKIRELPGFLDVTSDLQLRNRQVLVDIDRDRAAALGVSPRQIEDALYSAYGARQISTIFTPTNEYNVVLEVLPEEQLDPEALAALHVRSSAGALVPLGAVATLKPSVGPLTISHLGQLPAVTISFNLNPGIALGQGIAAIGKLMGELRTPATLNSSFQGSAQAFQASLAGMGMLLILAVFVIYLILGILYESFWHPVTILSGLPTAGLGALLTLKAFNLELDMYGFVGLVMLIGIVKKNAIMMIDFAIERATQHGMSAGGGDPRGRAVALPSDHDDDDGRADGHAAHRARPRRGRRGAAAARSRRRRRPAVLADPDALPHARRVRVSRTLPGLDRVASRRAARGAGDLIGAGSRRPPRWRQGEPRSYSAGGKLHAQPADRVRQDRGRTSWATPSSTCSTSHGFREPGTTSSPTCRRHRRRCCIPARCNPSDRTTSHRCSRCR